MNKFFICLLGGWFGLHKFIEGKVGLGILYLFTGGLLGVGWIVDTIIYLIKWLGTDSKTAVSRVSAQIPIVEPEPVSPEQLERMTTMCKQIHKEYKELLSEYKLLETDGKVWTLKECYRKLNVIETIVNKYKCYYDIDVYEEYENIEKKARAFINAYIKDEREAGNDIDIIQFSDDLSFISDYIYEKDEKLNGDA
jgi:hypothetical protein